MKMIKEAFMASLPKEIETTKMTKEKAKELAWYSYQRAIREAEEAQSESVMRNLFSKSEE